jgi:hypothetical protein
MDVDIKYQNDINIELKNALYNVVYHAYIEAKELGTEDITLVIPSSVGAPSVDISGMESYAVRIHNPGDEKVVVIINGIPIDVIGGHLGINTSCWVYVNEDGSSQQWIEARNSQGVLVSSLTLTFPDIGGIITLSPFTPVTFSLNFVNLSSQSLDITINGQPIGSIMPDTRKLFHELEVEPRMEWRSDRETQEQYMVEAKSSDNTIYYSRDITWMWFVSDLTSEEQKMWFTLDFGSEQQLWTIVIPPELTVRNLTNEMATVYIEGRVMGNVAPSQEQSFYGYPMMTDYSLSIDLTPEN